MDHGFHSNFNEQSYSSTPSISLSKYTAKTFAWMCIGLMITFVSALVVALSPLSIMVITTPALSIGLGIAQIVVVMFLSFRIDKMSVPTATTLFFSYSFLTGITFSSLFYAYGFGQVIGVFLLTSLYFGALAAFGMFTKTDLSKLGPMLMGGVVFLVLSGLLLLFFNIPMLETAMCLMGIVIFLGLTAYDTQKIRTQYYAYQGNQSMLAKASVISALQLYLDFINLFIYLLRFMNSNRD